MIISFRLSKLIINYVDNIFKQIHEIYLIFYYCYLYEIYYNLQGPIKNNMYDPSDTHFPFRLRVLLRLLTLFLLLLWRRENLRKSPLKRVVSDSLLNSGYRLKPLLWLFYNRLARLYLKLKKLFCGLIRSIYVCR